MIGLQLSLPQFDSWISRKLYLGSQAFERLRRLQLKSVFANTYIVVHIILIAFPPNVLHKCQLLTCIGTRAPSRLLPITQR